MFKRPLLRATALAIAILYFATNCAFAHKVETSVWDERKKAAQQQLAFALPQVNPNTNHKLK
jgi:hypothetical protein